MRIVFASLHVCKIQSICTLSLSLAPDLPSFDFIFPGSVVEEAEGTASGQQSARHEFCSVRRIGLEQQFRYLAERAAQPAVAASVVAARSQQRQAGSRQPAAVVIGLFILKILYGRPLTNCDQRGGILNIPLSSLRIAAWLTNSPRRPPRPLSATRSSFPPRTPTALSTATTSPRLTRASISTFRRRRPSL
jgi:hypothetical protein